MNIEDKLNLFKKKIHIMKKLFSLDINDSCRLNRDDKNTYFIYTLFTQHLNTSVSII